MRLAVTYLGLASLFNLVTLLTSYPWNSGENATSYGRRSQDEAGTRRQQQILQVIIPTESYRNDRIVTWPKHSNSNGQHYQHSSEQPYHRPNSSQEKTTLQRRKQQGGAHVVTRAKPRPNAIKEPLHSRLGVEDDPSVLCEEVQSRTATSQTYRRSPSPIQDASSKSQQVIKPASNKGAMCNSTTTLQPLTSSNRTLSASAPYKPPSSIPRPPTTNRPSLTTSRGSSGTTKALGDIVFPDRNDIPSYLPRTKCKGKTYCEDVDDYPTEHIRRLLKTETIELRSYFSQDELPEVNITHRIDVSDDTPLCAATHHSIRPRSAQNKDDDWMYILNVEGKTQGFRIETCVHEGDCALRDELPWGYTFTCKQKYILRPMLALSEKGEAVSEQFRLPSCCVCYFKSNPKGITSRMGLGNRMSPAITPRQNVKTQN